MFVLLQSRAIQRVAAAVAESEDSCAVRLLVCTENRFGVDAWSETA